jgi:Na+/proline symporter
MNGLDFAVLIISILSIAIYGIWHTRNRTSLDSYLIGSDHTPWWVIGLSVMATQASAITFLSTPGQGYLSGLGFIQIYFGVPIALVIISIFFLPIFNKLHVYTAYEFLERRFDVKTRVLGAGLFLLQRGIGAGLTIYAPAIVLSTVFNWSLEWTIICSGLVVIVYTVLGGTDAVTVTQKYQIAVIFLGMLTAMCLLLSKLPANLSFVDALHLAGGFQKLNAVNFSPSLHERYTFWSGLLGGTFLMLSYFGTDQSQVQRYISGSSLRESRLGLLFNAVCKIPMQFSILLLGVLMFVFYQFEQPPLFFDTASNTFMEAHRNEPAIATMESAFSEAHAQEKQNLELWLQQRHEGNKSEATAAFVAAAAAQQRGEKIRLAANDALAARKNGTKANDADYVFITFILKQLPHGAIGLLVAAFFAAALSSKAAELNALGTSTTIDFYRLLFKRDAVDAEYLFVTKWFTAFWGVIAIVIALYARLAENLIQAVNILGSIFYGVLLALFVVAFFIKRVGGTAVFWAALVAQTLVFILYYSLSISYLWYPLIGCAACVIFSLIFQSFGGNSQRVVREYAS